MGKPDRPKKTAGKAATGSNAKKFDPRLKKQQQEKRVAKNQDHVLNDERFVRIATDPRFRGLPAQDKKIQIDARFQQMFTDKKFNQKHMLDRRGRPVNFTSADNLQKFYQLDGGKRRKRQSENGTDTISDKPDGKSTDERFSGLPGSSRISVGDDNDTGESESDGDTSTRDLARGIGNVSSESEESSEEGDEDESDAPEIEHPWAELAADAAQTEDATRRMALVNMDWDSIRAEDILALLNSFKPDSGVIKSVTIYPSEFGLKRMEEEQWSGPVELRQAGDEDESENSDEEAEDEGEARKKANEKLRQYQLNKMKYYYAVIDCDSVETANKIYEECDGVEYENSSAPIDLRFIPDDMEFDQEAKSVATNLPASFKPSEFVISALQQSSVKCNWDETARDRKPLSTAAWEKMDDIQAFLASSSSEEEEIEDLNAPDADTMSVRSTKDPEAIARYRALILKLTDDKKPEQSEAEEDKESDSDVDMEVSWEPGVKASTKKDIKQKKKEAEIVNLTPFEKMLEKQKEKRKARKADGGSGITAKTAWENEESDDLESNSEGGEQQPADDASADDDGEEISQTKDTEAADLALLVEEPDGKRHFSMKKLLDDAKQTKSQRKRKRKRLLREGLEAEEERVEDDFQVNVQDPRFSALFTSGNFNIDQSDPSFKKTKAMDAVMKEKLTRKDNAVDGSRASGSSTSETGVQVRPEVSVLAKSVKAKLNAKKTRKF